MNYEEIYRHECQIVYRRFNGSLELVDKANQEYVAKLEMIRLGRLSLSDFS